MLVANIAWLVAWYYIRNEERATFDDYLAFAPWRTAENWTDYNRLVRQGVIEAVPDWRTLVVEVDPTVPAHLVEQSRRIAHDIYNSARTEWNEVFSGSGPDDTWVDGASDLIFGPPGTMGPDYRLNETNVNSPRYEDEYREFADLYGGGERGWE